MSQLCTHVERGTACARCGGPAAAPPRRRVPRRSGDCGYGVSGRLDESFTIMVFDCGGNVARGIECPVNARIPSRADAQQVVTRARDTALASTQRDTIDLYRVRAARHSRLRPHRPTSATGHRAQDSIRFSFRNSDGPRTRPQERCSHEYRCARWDRPKAELQNS